MLLILQHHYCSALNQLVEERRFLRKFNVVLKVFVHADDHTDSKNDWMQMKSTDLYNMPNTFWFHCLCDNKHSWSSIFLILCVFLLKGYWLCSISSSFCQRSVSLACFFFFFFFNWSKIQFRMHFECFTFRLLAEAALHVLKPLHPAERLDGPLTLTTVCSLSRCCPAVFQSRFSLFANSWLNGDDNIKLL